MSRSIVFQVTFAIGMALQSAPAADPEEVSAAGDDGSVVHDLGELIVVGTRTEQRWIDASGTTLRADSEDLLRTGSQDLSGFAKYDPTVSLPFDFSSGDGAFGYGQSGYGSINIRGAEGNRIAIELDGIRQPPQYVSTSFDMGSGDGAGGIGRDYFDPAMFDLVEVLKGGASALYGSDALGGVVAFSTPDPETMLTGRNAGGLVRLQYFSANESIAGQVGGAVKAGNTSVMLLYAGRHGEETANNGVEPPNPADFTSNSALLKAEHVQGDHTFRLALELFEREAFTDVRSAATSDFPVFDRYVLNNQLLDRQRASLKWQWTPQSESAWVDQLDSHAYWQHAGTVSENDSASSPLVIGGMPIPGTDRTRQQRISFDTDILGFSSVARKEFGSGRVIHAGMAGLDFSIESGANRFTRLDSGAPQDVNRTSFAPTDTTRTGFFLQDEIKVDEKWFITPGLRMDWQEITPDPDQAYLDRLASLGRFGQEPPTDYDNFSVSPRLNLAWKPTETMQWYGTYAHGVRNPSAEELSMIFDHPPSGGNPAGSLTVPNTSLQEEQSDAFELGFKSEGDAGRFQASVFYTRYRDFIENGVPTGELDDEGRDIVTTMNRGEAEIYGFELGGMLEAGHFHDRLRGWQIGMSTGKSIGNNLTDDVPLNSVEPWKTAGFFGYEDPEGRFGARLSGIYSAAVTRVDDTTNQGTFFRPPSWFTLDLAAWWEPSETVAIHAGFNNILDEKYWSWGSVRRGNGHLGGSATTDRSTAPGRNFSLSVTKTF
ncbi:TonB-dependent hemoglobin/transferrin/lactoferrin family receptor [Luteolibacter flavescens]|uniref:TonB-dependent hemoglobin/transferrin/lactoferrin family receptor n=1 Tax=Luteolibacter flavescens TaxID=1859460 RepID=A0ABT3FLY2_9BACT|nr:TonB-dependent hemoglobin/transferrin/lactoferrin family receptor [Luteolibacter flavescens]MCW1884354.1 TonB-dependent hemoglobin/transferrin/lactoferrin family receptor [Luteolibacter flavescens]